MPKSGAERTRDYLIRRRQLARETGLCCTCRKGKPRPSLVTCGSCNAAALKRQKRKREVKREAFGSAKLVEAHERAGDVAREHHVYAGSAALPGCLECGNGRKEQSAAPDDLNRILEKLIQALFLSGEPDAVNPWYDRLLTSYLAIPGDGAKAIDTMLKIARQRWIDSKTPEALPIIAQAIQLAEKIDEHSLWIRANLMMHSCLSTIRTL